MLRVRGLGDLEAAVMDRMWEFGRPMTVREVLVALNTSRDLAYTTVMTVMDNLHKKDWLRREMVSRAYVYSPVRTLEEYSAQLMESALHASSDSGATLVHFVQAMGDGELAALQEALRTARAGKARTGSAPAEPAAKPTGPGTVKATRTRRGKDVP